MLLEIAEREMAPDITVVELAGTLALGRESQRIETLVDDLVEEGLHAGDLRHEGRGAHG